MAPATDKHLVIIDAHVHIYPCYNLPLFLDSAYGNFHAGSLGFGATPTFTGVLLLTETSSNDWFHRLSAYAADNKALTGAHGETWRFHLTGEGDSLIARSSRGYTLILIAGRQIMTKEKLEALALATDKTFRENIPLRDLISDIGEKGGIPVIPWGVGKWFGKRGGLLRLLLSSPLGRRICLGDNGGRPVFWPRPSIFRIADEGGCRILPGTDPLPLASETSRCGSFGFIMRDTLSYSYPARDIRRLINDGTIPITPYGRLENPVRFFKNQLLMRLS